ncbi:MAG TPA: ferritin-like domain-containing protein [Dehalococcoidia bacterium]|nr:ferritin-like domain-containing protein [Dehalococcoidia bacterium]
MLKRQQPATRPQPAPVIEVLQRLWQTKLSTIALLEKWRAETADSELESGLSRHLIDERRHATMIGEQIRRLGGRITSGPKDAGTRAFAQAEEAGDDLQRLFALYRGVKPYTVDRCYHAMPHVDASLAQVLHKITLDEERHIRWADVRIQRLVTHANMRECNLIASRVRAGLQAAWERQWRHFSQMLHRAGA